MKTSLSEKNSAGLLWVLVFIADALWWTSIIMGLMGVKSILPLLVGIAFEINAFIIGRRYAFKEWHMLIRFLISMMLLQVIPYVLALIITGNLL